jgi:hypothetical protein
VNLWLVPNNVQNAIYSQYHTIMKKSFLFLFFIALFVGAQAAGFSAPPDSITDNWSVAYNGKEILAYKINDVPTYLIDSIADDAVITIDYYTDKPCPKCQSRLEFKDENGTKLAAVQKDGFGDGAPFRLPGRQFRQLIHNHKLYIFFSANPDGWGTWILLGVVKTTH